MRHLVVFHTFHVYSLCIYILYDAIYEFVQHRLLLYFHAIFVIIHNHYIHNVFYVSMKKKFFTNKKT
jgi:hypothetical protein